MAHAAYSLPKQRLMVGAIFVTLAAIAFGWFTLIRADLREAATEVRHPRIGETVKVNGRDVHVIVQGAGPDLVLIHGAGGNARDFTAEFTDRLTNRFRVFAVDRPGLGWSEQIDPALNNAFTSAAETPIQQARHLSAAVQQLGAKDPIVLGHSYGGAVAMAWALEEPTSGVVIVSGATMPWPGPLQTYYRVFGSLLGSAFGAPLVSAYISETRVVSAVEGVFAPASVPPDYFNTAAVMLGIRIDAFRTNARQVKALRANLVDMSANYAKLSLHVEIIHGTADTSVRPEIHAVSLSKTVPGANLTLLEGVGHAPHHVAPLQVEAAIDRIAARAGLR